MLGCVERREAPHPYVIGVRAPSQGARRTLARFARVRIATHPAPPGAPFPFCRGRKKGRRATGAPRNPGGGALSCRGLFDIVRLRVIVRRLRRLLYPPHVRGYASSASAA